MNENPTFRCAACGKPFPINQIFAGKCKPCFKIAKKRRAELEAEGFYSNLSRLGNWRRNSKRGKPTGMVKRSKPDKNGGVDQGNVS